MSQLQKLSIKMLEYIDQIVDRYKQGRDTGEKGDFYLEVKPFADKVKQDNDKWKAEAEKWIKDNSPKGLRIQQIQSAYDQMDTSSIQAFFPETSKSRFTNQVNSAKYVVQRLLVLIEEKES
ncbi:DUF1798 family protein [Bacillus sp. CRN 9]|uniref:DUF1798 family protein n=1 Tax=Cytobacillus horneckiae TaxID=549687 RepID=UPI002AA5770D